MKRLNIELTDTEAEVLAMMVEEALRPIQGDGTLSDMEDNALVELNAKLEDALRNIGVGR